MCYVPASRAWLNSFLSPLPPPRRQGVAGRPRVSSYARRLNPESESGGVFVRFLFSGVAVSATSARCKSGAV